jgi:hypothetical protein
MFIFICHKKFSSLFLSWLRHSSISFLMSVCPSVLTKQLRHKRTDFHDILILAVNFLWNILFRIQNSALYYDKFPLLSLHSISPSCLSDFNQRDFRKVFKKNFIHVCPVGAELFNVGGRTDRA